MATVAEITIRLAKAEQAYDDLMTGRAAKVLVDQNGERIEFVQANAGRLLAYIEELKRLLGISGRVVGPMRPFL